MEYLQTLLSEIDKLRSHLCGVRPLLLEAVRKIEQALSIEYTYESNRIEGNTLTLQETALVVNEGVTIAGKSMREHLEAINHAQAVEYIKEIARGESPVDERTIRDIHALVLHGIDRENAGRYRMMPVMISGSQHTPPAPYMVIPLMEGFIRRFSEMEQQGEHPVMIAAYLHDELVRIHPFIDGNGRTSRLLMNLYLLRRGYTLVNLKGSDEAKLAYYNALERSHTQGGPTDFHRLVAEAERDSLRRYLDILEA